MKQDLVCAISLALFAQACSSKSPLSASAPSKPTQKAQERASKHQDAEAKQAAASPSPGKQDNKIAHPPAASSANFDKAKLWAQLLSLGHLPLRSLKFCSKEPNDKRTLFSHLARVLGEIGGGVPREKAGALRPEASYTLRFRCSLHQPKAQLGTCTINANDLQSSGDLYFGLHFEVEAETQRILPDSITCD